ncbi:unnamed protein product [Agarophyton chilense]
MRGHQDVLAPTLHSGELNSISDAKPEKQHAYSLQEDLMSAYKEQCETARTAVGNICAGLIQKSRIPYLEDAEASPCHLNSVDDDLKKSEVVKEFTRAVEMLQDGAVPTKRRENLPKECVSYLKTWFYAHYDDPYPSDLEKLEMSRRTMVDVNQISHWFVNYRKRVWKPKLPPHHPAVKEGITKKVKR